MTAFFEHCAYCPLIMDPDHDLVVWCEVCSSTSCQECNEKVYSEDPATAGNSSICRFCQPDASENVKTERKEIQKSIKRNQRRINAGKKNLIQLLRDDIIPGDNTNDGVDSNREIKRKREGEEEGEKRARTKNLSA